MFDAQRLVQIGVCVKDLDEAMEYYKKNFGMGPFAIMDSDVEAANYYGRKRPSITGWRCASWGRLSLN